MGFDLESIASLQTRYQRHKHFEEEKGCLCQLLVLVLFVGRKPLHEPVDQSGMDGDDVFGLQAPKD